jgi:putative flippase GtrA
VAVDEPISHRRRVVAYCTGGIIAGAAGSGAFSAVYGGLHGGTVWASAAGFIAGATCNWFLTRRWAWSDRRAEDRVREVTSYIIISLTIFLSSMVATHYAEQGAKPLTDDHLLRTMLVSGAFVAVTGFFFVSKFVLYYFLVFTGRRADPVPPPVRPGATAPSRR